MISPVVTQVYFRRVYSRTALGLDISRKSTLCARNLTKLHFCKAMFLTLTRALHGRFQGEG